MKLLVETTYDSPKTLTNPTRGDVVRSLIPLLGNQWYALMLTRNNGEWLEARWNRGYGIELRCCRDGQLYENVSLFPNYRKTETILTNFANNRNAWENMVKWRPITSSFSVQKTLRYVQKTGEWVATIFAVTAFVIFFLSILMPQVTVKIDDLFTEHQLISGLLILLFGVGVCISTPALFVYRRDIKSSDPLLNSVSFYVGMIFLFCGLLIILAWPQ